MISSSGDAQNQQIRKPKKLGFGNNKLKEPKQSSWVQDS
jgi:beta-lactamase class D